MPNLEGCICLVTGASRGIGRGIALGLGECGATVYITGRTTQVKTETSVGGSLEETVNEIKQRGGKAIGVACDHSKESDVTALFNRIHREQNGRLDLLVNNAYSAVNFLITHSNQPFYNLADVQPGEAWDIVNNVGLRNNYICCVLAARMMVDYAKSVKEQGTSTGRPGKRSGLIINISSAGGRMYLFNVAYGVGKAGVDRMTRDMAMELKKPGHETNISIISLWPGPVRTEEVVSVLQSSSDGYRKRMFIDYGESTELSGRAVAALLAESAEKSLQRSGQVVLVGDVVGEYGIREVDGSLPYNMRSIKYLLLLGGYWLARIVPRWLRLPHWMYMAMLDRR